MAKVIVWDEAPMAHTYQIEALDQTLRDITGQDLPFGDKVIILCGGFRQCLPVIHNANRAEVEKLRVEMKRTKGMLNM